LKITSAFDGNRAQCFFLFFIGLNQKEKAKEKAKEKGKEKAKGK